MRAVKNINYYILLGLDIDPPEMREDKIREAINKKRVQSLFARKIELSLINDIKSVYIKTFVYLLKLLCYNSN